MADPAPMSAPVPTDQRADHDSDHGAGVLLIEHALSNYPLAMREALSGYHRSGNLFSKAIGNPFVMRLPTRHGLPRKTLMRFPLKVLANLYDPRGGDAADRLINGMTKLTPALK